MGAGRCGGDINVFAVADVVMNGICYVCGYGIGYRYGCVLFVVVVVVMFVFLVVVMSMDL